MRTILCLLLSLPLLTACSSTGVHVDSDPAYDFTGKRTYAWKPGVPADNELHQRRIVGGVDQALASRGFELVEAGADGAAPDLWVRSEVGGHRETRSTGGDVSVGVGRSVGGFGHVGVGTGTGNRIYQVEVGTLVVEILDGASEQVVWRAQGEKTLSKDPEQTKRMIHDAIEAAFAEFPPGQDPKGD